MKGANRSIEEVRLVAVHFPQLCKYIKRYGRASTVTRTHTHINKATVALSEIWPHKLSAFTSECNENHCIYGFPFFDYVNYPKRDN